MCATAQSLRFMASEHEHLTSDQAALLCRAAEKLDEVERLRGALKDIVTRAAAHFCNLPD